MKRSAIDTKNHDNKPRHGGRKVFFHRLWCRIQRIPLPKYEKIEDSPTGKSPGRPRSLSSPTSSGRKRKKSIDVDHDEESPARKYSKDESEMHDEMLDESHSKDEDFISMAFQGSIRLSRKDDPHWLSDSCCFIRKELVEAFTATEEDIDGVNATYLGQVGIRCVYCAKNQIKDRPKGHAYYPMSVAGIQDAVSDLQRR
jgi:hypothetical protein